MLNFKLRIQQPGKITGKQVKKRKFAGEKAVKWPFGLFLNQDRPVLFQIFFHGRPAGDGIGNSNGVGLGQFIMHQPLAHESNPEIQFGHAPELTGFQWFQTKAGRKLGFSHKTQFAPKRSTRPDKSRSFSNGSAWQAGYSRIS